ncbi:MarR family transcriptional regulator [Sphingomonas sp. So64.6b]|uniref:MarR family transcriptional regulator n=1 Tax=Sphingomonas sp. So64.6b TaxID=2997354 RepID=UPI0015FFA056|nr:MarR family transcriptional regulator [Sphingomonas sp. So64.6b]QNA85498.1 MarR family transcriptional regulator [Sphingomonas sp. So64.6b]
MKKPDRKLPAYSDSLAGTLLAAREAVMSPIRPMLRDAAVTEHQWRVLRVLDDHGYIEPTALAGTALLYAPSVARILKDLVERGLVLRAPHPGDGRRSVLSLSNAGKSLMRRTSAKTVAKLDDYTEQFGQERITALITELKALTEAIGSAASSGKIPSET